MSAPPPALLAALTTLALELPAPVIGQVAAALRTVPPGAWSTLLARAQQAAGTPHARNTLAGLIATWQQAAPAVTPESLALALESAAATAAQVQAQQQVELVWTGPASPIPLRRTAQALQQVIDAARHELIIVAFAVYDVPEIGLALARAANRGARLWLIVESPQASAGKIAYDGLAALGAQVVDRATVLRWPRDRRPQDASGKTGALHAKCAVADGTLAYVSSANLTHYALNLNMELGVLVRGGPVPQQVAAHWRHLVQSQVLEPLARD
ncbi:MAG TPA: DISARM system phospholipase D-like protein DrmC [Herpetosiphonaceae bacterium]